MKKLLLALALVLGSSLLFMGAYCNKNSSPSSSAAVSTNQVVMKSLAFSPNNITVSKGTTVTWTNQDSMAHTVTSNDNKFSSSVLDPNSTFNFTFNDAGTFSYHCSIHSNMTGQVTVK